MSFNFKTCSNSLQATQMFMLVCSFMMVCFMLWAYFCTIDILSMTKGEVVPSSKLKSIQHLEGGIVQKILVKEGDRVKKDDPLIELETTASDADLNEITLRHKSLSLDLIRLQHEAANKDELIIPTDSSFEQKDLDQVNAVFLSRRRTLHSQIKEQNFLIEQKKIESEETLHKVQKLDERIKLVDEQVTISESLLADELTNRYKHLDLLKELNSLETVIAESKAMLAKSNFILKQAEEHLSNITFSYHEEVESQLKEVKRGVEEIEQRLKKYQDHRLRRIMRAPVDGIVQRLYVFTEGGVIHAGTPVLDIVPIEDTLIIEAMLPIGDIGHVKAGMEAQVQLMTSDSRKYGHIMGKVELVSPDTITENNGTFYKIIVSTASDRFIHGEEEYILVPGLTLTVNILTGHRSILEMIFSPFLERLDFALKER